MSIKQTYEEYKKRTKKVEMLMPRVRKAIEEKKELERLFLNGIVELSMNKNTFEVWNMFYKNYVTSVDNLLFEDDILLDYISLLETANVTFKNNEDYNIYLDSLVELNNIKIMLTKSIDESLKLAK